MGVRSIGGAYHGNHHAPPKHLQPPVQRVRFMHAAQGQSLLEARLDNGQVLASGVLFTKGTEPIVVTPGKYDVEVCDGETGAPLFSMLGVVAGLIGSAIGFAWP